ncbi:MAG: hypothetical protein R3300_08780, partial [Candidatus Promineifilaceae bacterium]|nr:hypothetical protein [Candidatus Promineifilaceae bacterium]
MSDELNELDFTIEMNAEGIGPGLEADLFAIADARLRELAGDKNDMIGAAVNIRQPAAGETPPLHEVTVVAYTRPKHVAATEKQRNVIGALKGALDAVERQIKQKREN